MILLTPLLHLQSRRKTVARKLGRIPGSQVADFQIAASQIPGYPPLQLLMTDKSLQVKNPRNS